MNNKSNLWRISCRSILYCMFISLCGLSNAFAQETADLKGYWAMKPFATGTANVSYFDGQGKSILYSFTCHFEDFTVTSDEAPEKSNYQVMDGVIHLSYPQLGEDMSQTLIIKNLEKNYLRLEQAITPDVDLYYEYERVDGVQHLCPSK